jgi:D-3-phosphoglycerate dehydrogenase
VYNDPHGNTTSAAEQTMALMLSAARHTWKACNGVKGGEFSQEKYLGKELSARTLGIIGLGKIGSKVSKYANAFGMKVLCYDPYIPDGKAEGLGVERLSSLDELVRRSDVITVHTPLNDETRGMVGEKEFALMKDGVIIVNCARGGIVDEKALYENLKTGKVFAAGIDVWTCEPIEKGSWPEKLLSLPNVVGTPHLGAKTVDAQDNVGITIAKQTINALRGEMVENALNLPYMLEAAELEKSRGFMNAAKVLGSMLYQLGRGKITKVSVAFGGRVPEAARKPVVSFAVQGLLEKTQPQANIVNSMLLAEEAGIKVGQAAEPVATNYANAIVLTATYEDGHGDSITGSIFSHKFLRLVGFNGYEFEAKAAHRMLWVFNKDVPGVVGLIGTALEKSNVNIAEMILGRRKKKGEAVAVLAVDSEVPAAAIEGLKQDKRIGVVRQISLDESLIYAPNSSAPGSEE